MKYKTQILLCTIISVATLFASLFCINYVIKSSIYKNGIPYGMSINFLKLVRPSDVNVMFEEAIDVDLDTNLTIISEFNDTNYMGIYDPAYFYVQQNSIIAPGTTRYFSTNDYKNKVRSAIFVKDVDFFSGLDMLDAQKSPLVDDFIFHINSLSVLYDEGNDYIINLASLPHMGDVIYIDSKDIQEVNLIANRLVSYGYKVASDYNYIELFLQTIINDAYSRMILIPVLLIYPLFLLTTIFYFSSIRRITEIHKYLGATKLRLFGRFSRLFFGTNSCMYLISPVVIYYWLNDADANFKPFSITDIYIISLAIFTIYAFLFYIGFCISYKYKILGEAENVR